MVIVSGDTQKECGYTFYIEVIHLLIVLFSGQLMQSPNSKEETLFIKLLMEIDGHLSRKIVARLLKNFIQQQECPSVAQVGFLSSAYSFVFGRKGGNKDVLPDKSIILLLLLINQHPRGFSNNFREILCSLVDIHSKYRLLIF